MPPVHIRAVVVLFDTSGDVAGSESWGCPGRSACGWLPCSLVSGAWGGGGDGESGGLGSVAEAAVPGGEDEAWLADGQGAGQVYCVGPAQGVAGGELAGAVLDGAGELDGAGG